MRASSIFSALCLMCLTSISAADQLLASGPNKSSVVELFTSEGCSSCPPADEYLSKLGKTKESAQIIPLAFHVDYWDYIGWKDPYAKGQFTKRQRAVAKQNGQSTVYTPEFVVDGAEARGSRLITRKVKSAQRLPAEADIQLNLSSVAQGRLTADVVVSNVSLEDLGKAEVYLAIYENDLVSRISAGENRGRRLKHDYVVRYLSAAQPTEEGGQHQFTLELDPEWKSDDLGVAVVVRLQGNGATLQALKTDIDI